MKRTVIINNPLPQSTGVKSGGETEAMNQCIRTAHCVMNLSTANPVIKISQLLHPSQKELSYVSLSIGASFNLKYNATAVLLYSPKLKVPGTTYLATPSGYNVQPLVSV